MNVAVMLNALNDQGITGRAAMKLAMQIDNKNWEERWEARETVNAQVQAAKDPETIKAKQALGFEGRHIGAQAEATKPSWGD